jgi:hypothetical protein
VKAPMYYVIGTLSFLIKLRQFGITFGTGFELRGGRSGV